MKILIDCSNLKVGGGMQVALSFLYDIKLLASDEKFIVMMSPQFANTFDRRGFNSKFSFFELEERDYTNIFKRGRAIKRIETKVQPDIIFTVFGPAYHRSNFPRITGYALAQYIYFDSPFFKLLSAKEKVRRFLNGQFRVKLFKRSDKLIFETQDVQQRFCKKYNYNIKDTFVVSNTLNQLYLNPDLWTNKSFNFIAEKSILCLSANYKHKNIAIIPSVIDSMREKGLKNFKFILSLNKEELNFDADYDDYIEYLGKLPLEVLPSLFKAVDLLFLPTLLECFSTTYLEAMYMEVPIVTTNLSFARDICGNSALYFDPLNPENAAEKIIEILCDNDLSTNLISNGKNNLKRFGTSSQRTNAYLNIIRETSQV